MQVHSTGEREKFPSKGQAYSYPIITHVIRRRVARYTIILMGMQVFPILNSDTRRMRQPDCHIINIEMSTLFKRPEGSDQLVIHGRTKRHGSTTGFWDQMANEAA
jgi:hypothetical protein